MVSEMQKVEFDALLTEARERADEVISNLQLVGIDSATAGAVADVALTLPLPEMLGRMSKSAEFPRGDLSVVSSDDPLDPEAYVNALETARRAGEQWIKVRDQLENWWNGIQFFEDPHREPAVTAINVPIYRVAVHPGAPGGVLDKCTWSATSAKSGKLELTLGIPGLSLGQKTEVTDSKTVQVSTGEAKQVFIEATTVLKPTRMFANGKPTEVEGFVPTALRFNEPLTIGANKVAPFPDGLYAKPLRGYAAQLETDPEPVKYSHAVEREATFSLTIPLEKAGGKSLGLSLSFGSAFSTEHELTLVANHEFALLPTRGVPGTILIKR